MEGQNVLSTHVYVCSYGYIPRIKHHNTYVDEHGIISYKNNISKSHTARYTNVASMKSCTYMTLSKLHALKLYININIKIWISS